MLNSLSTATLTWSTPSPLQKGKNKKRWKTYHVQHPAQAQVGSLDDYGRSYPLGVAVSGLLTLPHCLIIQFQLLQPVPNLRKPKSTDDEEN